MKTQIKQIAQHGLDNLMNNDNVQGCNLHHQLYNMDYFIIGTYQAKQFLNKFEVFKAIDIVTQYEKDQFGEITTEISSPEKLVNMLAYVIGEELLQECPTLQAAWDDVLTHDDIKAINKELKQAVNKVIDKHL